MEKLMGLDFIKEYRAHPEDLSEIYVRNNKGQMVPMDSLVMQKSGVGCQ